MKIDTESYRNLAGGFVGGMLGTLACWYLHPIATTVGCFVGVVLGYRGDTVVRSVVNFFDVLLAIAVKPKRIFEAMLRGRPHPMTFARLVIGMALLTFVMLNIAHVVLVGMLVPSIDDGIGKWIWWPWFMGTLVFVAIATMMFISMELGRWEKGHVSHFYHEWDLWQRGALRYFATKFSDLVRGMIAIASTISILVSWFVVGGLIFLVFITSPVALAFGGAYGFFQACREGKYWLCLGMTIVVTSLSVWLLYHHFADMRILMITALSTGTVAGVAAEAARQAILWTVEVNEKVRALAHNPWGERVATVNKYFTNLTDHTFEFVFADKGFVARTAPPFVYRAMWMPSAT